MFRESWPISIASLSDLLARFIAIAQKSPDIALICAPEFYEHYHRVRRQLEKLQILCQRYSSLKFVYYLSREDSSLAESTSVTFCAPRTDPAYAHEDPLTATLRLLDFAEQMQKDVQTKPQKIDQAPSSYSHFGVTSSEAEQSWCKGTGSQQLVLVCYLREHEVGQQFLSSLIGLVGRGHSHVEILGLVRVCVSSSVLSASLETRVPTIHIHNQQPLPHTRSAGTKNSSYNPHAQGSTFPPFNPISGDAIFSIACINPQELYDCIAWSIFQLAQRHESATCSLKMSFTELQDAHMPLRSATSGYLRSLDHGIRGIHPHHQWWSAVALAWIAFAESKLDNTELLSAVAAEIEQSSLVSLDEVCDRQPDDGRETRLQSILREALIVSEAGKIMVSREEAKSALRSLILDHAGLDDGAIHEMIAYTCLCCIERHQPASVFRPWTVIESYLGQKPSTSGLLLYATSSWHMHFRLAEKCSRRLSVLLQRIIQSAIAMDSDWCHAHQKDAVQMINAGMWLCAFYDFGFLARTYLEMGAELVAASWPCTSPLHVAASRSSLNVLKVILSRHPALEMMDLEGMTALHVAAFHGHLAVVKILLAAGSNVNAISPESGDNTLHIAIRSGQDRVVTMLLEEGAQVNATNMSSETAMYIALQQEKHSIAKILDDWGAAYPNLSAPEVVTAELNQALQTLSLAGQDASAIRDFSSYVMQDLASIDILLRYRQE